MNLLHNYNINETSVFKLINVIVGFGFFYQLKRTQNCTQFNSTI